MSDWRSVLKGDVVPWLLEEENPSVRYFTLKEILDKKENNKDVRKARSEIMISGVVPKILAKQKPGGNWEEPHRFYTAKYKGSVWQLLILAELGADGNDPKIKKACEFILQNSFAIENGGFSIDASKNKGGGLPRRVIPCLTGNMLFSLIRMGYIDDERVMQGIDWITKYQQFNDGVESLPKGLPFATHPACWGNHSCHMGVVKALKCLAEIPKAKRSRSVKNTIEAGAEFMLIHHIHRRSHNLNRDSKAGWRKFRFPQMYQTDILEIVGILAKLNYNDERMQEAIDIVLEKQDRNGKWKLENTFNGKYQVNIERKDKPSKWITLKALSVLKSVY